MQPDPDLKINHVDPATKLRFVKLGYPFFKTYFTTWNYGLYRDPQTGRPEARQPSIAYALYPEPDLDDEEEELGWGVKENEVSRAGPSQPVGSARPMSLTDSLGAGGFSLAG